MGKKTTIWLIAAVSLILIGCFMFAGVMSIMEWNFTGLSTERYITNDHLIQNSFTNISIQTDTADIVFVPSTDGFCNVVCYETDNAIHTVTVADGTLTIRQINEKKWYDYIGINVKTPKLTVSLPSAEYTSLFIEESTGDIEIPDDFTFGNIRITCDTGSVKNYACASGVVQIHTGTGAIHVENVSTNGLDLSVSTGEVTVSDILCKGNFSINVSTGKASISDIRCKAFSSNGSTGDIILHNVSVKENASIQRSTGDVRLENFDAAEISIQTDTGNVVGTLLSEKNFITETSTGSVNVPNSVSGGTCRITTSTGNITIKIAANSLDNSKIDAAVFILLGQSNAVGHKLHMTPEDRITEPMKNVFGLHRTLNQKLDLEELTWTGYTSEGMNLGETQDHTYSIANCLAMQWQAHIDAGNAANLPDLYIIHIAIGAEGVSGDYMWNPDREPHMFPGVLGLVDISLYPFSQQIFSLVDDSFWYQGLDYDYVGLHWRGGENDISAVHANPQIDLEGIYTTMIEGFNNTLNNPPIYLHKIVAKDRMAQDNTGLQTQIMEHSNQMFDGFSRKYENVFTFDARNYPGYDPSITGEGIFRYDLIHFTADVNQWVAQEILANYIAKK